jgi:hypothetical protein
VKAGERLSRTTVRPVWNGTGRRNKVIPAPFTFAMRWCCCVRTDMRCVVARRLGEVSVVKNGRDRGTRPGVRVRLQPAGRGGTLVP